MDRHERCRAGSVGLVLFASLLAACTDGIGGPADAPPSSATSPSSPSPTAVAPSPSPETFEPLAVRPRRSLPAPEDLPTLTVSKLADGHYPAGIDVAPDGRIFFTELFGGVIRVIDRDGGVSEWFDVNERFGIEWTQFYHGGLTAIAVDPAFRKDHFIFAVTQVPSEKTGYAEKSLILRFVERNGKGTHPKVLLTLPAERFDNVYSLVFASDGTIFVPSGHSSSPGVADVPGDLVGEILHITRTGAAAPGSPFGAKAPRTWAHGIRNSFDLAVEPATGYLVGGENGTDGHDEIDLIAPGRYYGWSEHEGIVRSATDMTQPLVDFGPGHWAPVGMIRYDGVRFPRLRGLFLVCMNHQPGVYAMRIDPGPPARLLSFSKIASTCSIDIAASSDGRIFIADPQAIYELT